MTEVSSLIGEGNGTPLQYSCLGNPTDGGTWWAAVHGVAKSWTRLSNFTFIFHFDALEREMATHSRVLGPYAHLSWVREAAAAAAAKSLQSCPTLCDPIGGSPPSSSFPGILHARVLEWVAVAFSEYPACC